MVLAREMKNIMHNLKTCFGEQAHFMGVEFEGKLISPACLSFRKTKLFILKAVLSDIVKFQLLHLQDHMIKEAIRAGASKYNFYGITAEPKASLLRFKAGFFAVWRLNMLVNIAKDICCAQF